MKYLKKIFEAEIKRTFDEWLQNPQAKRHESIYTFEFPVKKVYNIDEGNGLDGDNLIDFLKYERGNDICKDIANELDLGYGLAGDFDDEEEYQAPKLSSSEVRANFDEYFERWIEQVYNNDMSKFYRMYDLDFEELEIGKDELDAIKTTFNQEDLKQYYPYREFNQDFKIIRMEITGMKDENIIVGEIETNRDLTPDEIDSIKDYLTGQCSDGWGEGLSQEQEKEEKHGLKFFVNISPWWSGGFPNWYLEIKQK